MMSDFLGSSDELRGSPKAMASTLTEANLFRNLRGNLSPRPVVNPKPDSFQPHGGESQSDEAPGKDPQVSSNTPTPKKFSVLSAGHFFLKGVLSPVTEFVKHPLQATAMLVGTWGLLKMIPRSLPLLLLGGVGYGLYEVVSGIIRSGQAFYQGQYAKAESMFESLGSGVINMGLSGLGLKSTAASIAEWKALDTAALATQGSVEALAAETSALTSSPTSGKSLSVLESLKEVVSIVTTSEGRRTVFTGFKPSEVIQNVKSNVKSLCSDPTRPAKTPPVSSQAEATLEVNPVKPGVPLSRAEIISSIRQQVVEHYQGQGDAITAKVIAAGKISEEELYGEYIQMTYDKLRLHEYPSHPNHLGTIDSITGAETTLTEVLAEKGWFYRLPKNRKAMGWSTHESSIDRVSLNVHGHPELIQALDQYFATGKVKGYYKTPDEKMTHWLKRHDPITLYFHEPLTPAMEQDIVAMAQKFIRTPEDVLVGRKIAPGVAVEKTPTVLEIQEAVSQAKKIDPNLGGAVEKYLSESNPKTGVREPICSSGQMTVVRRFLVSFAP
ncbi:MAG: hypothetical protein K2X66_05935 [Cyanobacteria bacterium]|nr:hypothetical protein [Cyanobacteriota bacterium]